MKRERSSANEALYADAAVNDPLSRKEAEEAGVSGLNEAGFYKQMRHAYMAVSGEFGKLLYSLVRSTRAKTVVEFGTSFGISTIYLAAALRDNGGGKVVTTEFEAGKAERARKNLTDAGLVDMVEFRVGDALQTLADFSEEIDMLFLDGAKGLYIEVLRLLEPRLRTGAIVASDNTDHEGMEAFLEYIRNPANGYLSSALLTHDGQTKGHEVSVRS